MRKRKFVKVKDHHGLKTYCSQCNKETILADAWADLSGTSFEYWCKECKEKAEEE